jgi:DNA primase
MVDHREFVDFKALKTRVQMGDVLDALGVCLKRVNASSLKGDCPLPTHSSARRGTFFVNDKKSVWYCHSDSCKKNGNRAGGNIIDFVAAIRGLSAYDAARHLDSLFPTAGTSAVTKPSNSSPPSVRHEAGGNKPLGFVLKDANAEHIRIQERGISIATAQFFGIGYFPGKGSMSDRIVFPLRGTTPVRRLAGVLDRWMGQIQVVFPAEDSPSAVSPRLRRSDTDRLANSTGGSHN